MESFIYVASPARVVFGAGALDKLDAEVERLGVRRALVLSTPGQRHSAEDIARRLGARAVGVFAHAAMHVPIENAHAAREETRRLHADGLVAFGGGSTIGLAKAIALESELPILAIPTTYAGSEMTPIFGITAAGSKQTGRDARVLPRAVVYDPALTIGLPVGVSITSGLNAIAHAAEGLYAQDRNPVIDLLAEEGIRALAHALPDIRARPGDLEARSRCLYGAWLCGIVLGATGMALHHKLCHVLGGTFDLPHAETHAVVLPHAIAYNAAAAPGAMTRIARALGRPSAASALFDLAHDNGAPVSLRALGLAERDLDRAAVLAVANPYWNPRPVERAAVRALLEDAWHGRRPDESRPADQS